MKSDEPIGRDEKQTHSQENRHGFEYWDRLCKLTRYSFLLDQRGSVRRVPSKTGNWIQVSEAQQLMDATQVEINTLRAAVTAQQAIAPAKRKFVCPTLTVADLVNNLLLLDQTLPIYGAQYIDHPTRGHCAIAVPPTVSRERVQDSRWIGKGDALNAAVVWTRAAQPTEPAHARTPSKSDDHLSTAIGLIMGFKQRHNGYADNSVIAKFVTEVEQYLKDWPDTQNATPPAGNTPTFFPNGVLFDWQGNPRTRFVRVKYEGSALIIRPEDLPAYQPPHDYIPYVFEDTYLSEEEFDAIPEFDGF